MTKTAQVELRSGKVSPCLEELLLANALASTHTREVQAELERIRMYEDVGTTH